MASPRRRSISGSTISRQFTDSERALDDRITQTLTQPPAKLNIGHDYGETVRWLQEDMALRSGFTKQLADEQNLALQQSARHQLAREAELNDERDAQASEAFSELRKLEASGISRSKAINQLLDSTPGLALNESFTRPMRDYNSISETPEQESLRTLKDDIDRLNLGTQYWDLSIAEQYRRENPAAAEEAMEALDRKLKTEGLNSMNAAASAQLQQWKLQKELEEVERNKSIWPSGTDISLGSLGDIIYSFDESRFVGIENPEAIVKTFGADPAVMEMLSNKSFLSERFPDDQQKQSFVAAINAAVDEDASPADRRRGMSVILGLSGANKARMEIAKKDKERETMLNEVSKDMPKTYATISKQINDVAKERGAGSTIIQLASDFITQFEQSTPLQFDISEEAQAARRQIEEEANKKNIDNATASKRAREIMLDFSTAVRNKREAQARPSPASPRAVREVWGRDSNGNPIKK